MGGVGSGTGKQRRVGRGNVGVTATSQEEVPGKHSRQTAAVLERQETIEAAGEHVGASREGGSRVRTGPGAGGRCPHLGGRQDTRHLGKAVAQELEPRVLATGV